MSDVNLIKDKIREEFEKEFPSKKKVKSYLLDLLNKDKYPSLSEIEFYDVVGNTYKLNLDYKFNLETLFYPIYDELKKKIKKLYGDEKRLEMKQYLLKNFGLFSKEHILNRIIEEYECPRPKESLWKLGGIISPIFSDLISKEEYQHLSDSDFYFIVGETFKLNPKFFMDELYKDLRQILQNRNSLTMDKYIIENYCLLDGERIIFECNGNLSFTDSHAIKESGGIKISGNTPAVVEITTGTIFLTNYRLIAQGLLNSKGGRNLSWGFAVWALSGDSRKKEAIRTVFESSLGYGYQFPSRNSLELYKEWNGVRYTFIQDNQFKVITIKLTSKEKREEQVNTLYQILSKDVNDTKGTIKGILEMKLKDSWKRKNIVNLLVNIRERQFTDSEFLDIVEATYKMDPQFFMEHIFGILWNISKPSIAPIKTKMIELIEKLNKDAI